MTTVSALMRTIVLCGHALGGEQDIFAIRKNSLLAIGRLVAVAGTNRRRRAAGPRGRRWGLQGGPLQPFRMIGSAA